MVCKPRIRSSHIIALFGQTWARISRDAEQNRSILKVKRCQGDGGIWDIGEWVCERNDHFKVTD